MRLLLLEGPVLPSTSQWPLVPDVTLPAANGALPRGILVSCLLQLRLQECPGDASDARGTLYWGRGVGRLTGDPGTAASLVGLGWLR